MHLIPVEKNMTDLLREDKGAVCTLTLNRPDQFNALSASLLSELNLALSDLAQSEHIQVIRLRANGRAFCAGHDLREMRTHSKPDDHRRLFSQCSTVMQQIVNAPQVVIAEVHSIATAAGCQLAASCDLVVAGRSARFAVSGINLGLFCSTPAVALSRRIGRGKAMKMLMSGEFVPAETAERWGLVDTLAEDDELDTATQALVAQVAAKPLAATRTGKTLFQAQLDADLATAYQLAGEAMACNMTDADAIEGIDAFLQKRDPEFKPKAS